ncbi:MAG: heparinase II/III family protein [Planctomycetota bacterium]
MPVFELTQLESRRLLSATPSTPEAFDVLDKPIRQALLNDLTVMNATTRNALQAELDSNDLAGFDATLLAYSESQPLSNWFFDSTDIATYAAFATNPANGISYTGDVGNADDVVDDRMFPEIENVADYTVNKSNAIDWNSTSGATHPDFLHTLNRHNWWPELATAARLDGDPKYLNDLEYQLASWSQQYTSADTPSFWSEIDQQGWLLDTSIRTEYWQWAYFTALGDAGWEGDANTLMLVKLNEAGEFLLTNAQAALDSGEVDSNRDLTLAKTLQHLGQAFPEFAGASDWKDVGRQLLFASMDAQLYDDGSHVEQSPGYAAGVVEDLIDSYLLDVANGDAAEWAGGRLTKLENAADTYVQFLTPDGKRPALGDTYRTSSVNIFLRSALAFGNTDVSTTTITSVDSGNGTTTTTFVVADASEYNAGDIVQEQGFNEAMLVTDVSGNTITVKRAQFGTNPSGLENGDTLTNFSDIPLAKPRLRDVWLFGPTAVGDFTSLPASGVFGDRGQVTSLPDSGNYIFRDAAEEVQTVFDAGPKGGVHGHYDLLNLEIFGEDRALIADPGPFKYITDTADPEYDTRAHAISTARHNTIVVDGTNHGAYEKSQSDGNLGVYEFTDQPGFVQVSASHQAYAHLVGSPTVGRTVWYDKDGTFIIVDYAQSTSTNDFEVNYTMPGSGSGDARLTAWSSDGGGQQAKSRWTDGGKNVRIWSMDMTGQTHETNSGVFVTDINEPDFTADARKYSIRQSGSEAVFVTLVQVYDAQATPDVTIEAVGAGPNANNPFQLRLRRDGVFDQDITFTPPDLYTPDADANINGGHNDIVFGPDGRLHKVFLDRGGDTGSTGLKYTVRDPITGDWSSPVTIDGSSDFAGQYPDLELDNLDRPAVAYFDGNAGDLKYAYMSPFTDSFQVQTVDSKQSVGLYPSLTFTRSSNAALIGYYHNTKGELRVAAQQGDELWDIETMDGAGSDKDTGRFSQIRLDPNRTDLNSRYVIGYEDTRNGTYKWGYFYGGSFRTEVIDDDLTIAGGYLSLDFVDSGSGFDNAVLGDKWQPVVSYYSSVPDTSLKYAARTKPPISNGFGTWNAVQLDGVGSSKKVGLYSSLQVVNNRPDIFYFDSKNNLLKRVTQNAGGTWDYADPLATGGREIHIDRNTAGTVAVTSLDESVTGGRVKVFFY